MQKIILGLCVCAAFLNTSMAANNSVSCTLDGVTAEQKQSSLATIKQTFNELNIKPRISLDEINQYFLCENKGDFKKSAWISNGKLTSFGQHLFNRLNNSINDGLLSKNYSIDLIEELMKDPQNDQKINILMAESLLSYIRDISIGQPELTVLDREWLLPREKINAANVLLKANNANSFDEAVKSVEPKHLQYVELKKSLASMLKEHDITDTSEPVFTEGKTLRKGDVSARVIELKNRLKYLGYTVEDTESNVFDDKLSKAVANFQKNHLLEPDSVVGPRTQKELNQTNQDRVLQVMINLERWRWVPKDMGQHHLVVDIPGFEYYVMKDNTVTLRAKTVVGMAQRSTPVFMSPMSYIVFAPYWNVPRSLAVKDKLPQLKRDPERLSRSNIRIYDRNGNEVDPVMVDWSRYNNGNFPFRLRQDPGTYNALGRVKFMFPNEHAIYLHDTPQRSLFNKTERTFSSGCVRIENPLELAEYFLKDQKWNEQQIKNAYHGKKERTVRLSQDMKFPVYTLYMTTAVKDGEVEYRSDIYNRDQAIKKAMLKKIN